MVTIAADIPVPLVAVMVYSMAGSIGASTAPEIAHVIGSMTRLASSDGSAAQLVITPPELLKLIGSMSSPTVKARVAAPVKAMAGGMSRKTKVRVKIAIPPSTEVARIFSVDSSTMAGVPEISHTLVTVPSLAPTTAWLPVLTCKPLTVVSTCASAGSVPSTSAQLSATMAAPKAELLLPTTTTGSSARPTN